MAKNKFRSHIHVGAHVEDLSGCIGTIIGTGKWVGTVTVDFGNGCTRDLFTDKLKPARYSPAEIKAMESEAVKMYEAVSELLEALPVMTKNHYQYIECKRVKNVLDTVERKCPTLQKKRP